MANSDRFLDVGPKAVAASRPSCPKCRSTDVCSAAKHPTLDSYWRCVACGQVWSPGQLAAAAAQGRRR